LEPLLTAVVPISNSNYQIARLLSWLPSAVEAGIRIILVHDIDPKFPNLDIEMELAPYLNANVQMIEGTFGNPGTARNMGLDLVKSRWVAFWDADDFVFVDRMVNLVNETAMAGKRIGVGQYQIQKVESTDKPTERKILEEIIENIAMEPGIWRLIFAAGEVEEIRFPELSMGEDQVFLAEVGIDLESTYIGSEVVYTYMRGMSGQLTENLARLQDLKEANSEIRKILRNKSGDPKRFAILLAIRQNLTIIKKFKFPNNVVGIFNLVTIHVKYSKTAWRSTKWIMRKNFE